MTQTPITKETFLANLEKAIKQLICNRLFENEDATEKQRLAENVEDFIRENASCYTLEELKETFVSAEVCIGLFLEYQDAKLICSTGKPGEKKTGCGACQVHATSEPVFPSDTWQEPTTGMAFVWVPGHSFHMGSGPWDDQGLPDEKPVHEVWLDGFWICKFPVTVSQYTAFVQEVGKHAPAWLEPGGQYNIHTGTDDRYKVLGRTVTAGDYPIVGVAWEDAVAYARWLSQKGGFYFRLPTEAEWEYAARSGGKPEKYAGGPAADAVAWYADNSGAAAHPVGEKAPNGLGIHDMCGNVCEWCQDIYRKDGYRTHRQYNPQCAEGGTCRVVRGGSWQYGARDVRCADRGLYVPDYRGCDLGFRLVRPA